MVKGESVLHLPEMDCNATNCTHWLPGNLCRAGGIEIFAHRPGAPARATGDTACRSFRYDKGLTDQFLTLDNVNWSGLAGGLFQPGAQITPAVRCAVTACLHHRQPADCAAPHISVSGTGATENTETDCATFLPRHGD